MRLFTASVVVVALSGLTMAGMTVAAGKTSTVKGSIYRGDKSHPVSGAVIILLDEKNSGEGFDTKTGDNGNYEFLNVTKGRYTISIRTWHERQEDVPCQLLMAKTKDKNSTVIVAQDQARYVEQIFVKDFSVKSGKTIERDFDITCISMTG